MAVSAESIVGLISGGSGALGVMVIWMILILSGKLHTDGEFSREAAALDREKTAHEETRRALSAANARADAAVQASTIIANAITPSAARSGGSRHHVAVPEKD